MAGVVHIPWYATTFRADRFEPALELIAPLAIRFGATDYRVYRNRDDRYKFLQMAEFEAKADWEAYWFGPEFVDFRIIASSWYQVPVVYGWTELVTSGTMAPEMAHSVSGDPIGAEPGGDLAG